MSRTSWAASGSTFSSASKSCSPIASGRTLKRSARSSAAISLAISRDRLGRHLLDELFLLVLVEALEDGRRVLGGHAREQLGRLVGLELADDVGEVLGVDLVEQLAHLIRILLEDLLDVGAEEGGEAHGERARLPRSRARPSSSSVGSLSRLARACAYPHC